MVIWKHPSFNYLPKWIYINIFPLLFFTLTRVETFETLNPLNCWFLSWLLWKTQTSWIGDLVQFSFLKEKHVNWCCHILLMGFGTHVPFFCQLIQTMESELSRTRVNRCEVWTNSIRYFSLLSKHVLDSCVMKGLNWEPQIVPFFGLVHHKGGGWVPTPNCSFFELVHNKGVDLRDSIRVLISWSLNLWYYICFLMDFGLRKLRALLRMTIHWYPLISWFHNWLQ